MVLFILRNIPNKVHEEIEVPKSEFYDTLPDKYDPNTWPCFTSLQCFNCTLTSKRIPVFAPVSRTEDGRLSRGGGPIYCNIGCLYRSLIDSKASESERKKQLDLTKELVFQMTGVEMGVITPTDSRAALKRFGGSKSDAEYQTDVLYFCSYIAKFYKNNQDYLQDSK